MRRRLAVAVAAGLLLLATGGCAGTNEGGGEVTVLAAASLSDAFKAAFSHMREADVPVRPTFSFAGSQQLVAQVQAGAPADVVATADEASMAKLVAAGLVEAPVVFATNRLELAVRGGNPKGVRSLQDLARPDLVVVLADPSVPAGRYAAQALQRAGVTAKPSSLELDVRGALRKVDQGEADVAIVYATDLTTVGAAVQGVPIPEAANVTARYSIAVVKDSRHAEAAHRFVSEILTGPGRKVLPGFGFGPP